MEMQTDGAILFPSRFTTTTIGLLQPIVTELNKVIRAEVTIAQFIEGAFTYIKEAEKDNWTSSQKAEANAETNAIHLAIRKDLDMLHGSLTGHLNGITASTNVILETVEKTLKATEDLKGGTNDLICRVGNVTSVADKIASTTQSYRDVLVARQAPSHKNNVDPKVLGDMERKAKQILIDTFDEEGTNTLEKSQLELVDKANEVISKLTDASKPEKARVDSAIKTKKGAILLTLNSKEAAAWIREPEIEMAFADSFAKGAHIRDREYSLVLPSVPLTFEPDNETHLREVEEVNSLPYRAIRKARWIKPVGRRRPEQTRAFAILTVSSVDTANKLIKDGIAICSNIIRPTKQKQEPVQCMKCRRWGHFAANCPDAEDTCGTCGGKHRTSNCDRKDKLHCVSCGDNSHASWDRACPEFIKRCALLDERNPLNGMPFFPTDQDWTLVSRPSRIPLEERFPATFAVNSLQYTAAKPAGAAPQRKMAAKRATKAPRENPNWIPLPSKNNNNNNPAPKEAGELTEQEGEPSWAREPTPKEPFQFLNNFDKNGVPTQHHKEC